MLVLEMQMTDYEEPCMPCYRLRISSKEQWVVLKKKKIFLTPVKNGKEDFIQEGLLQ